MRHLIPYLKKYKVEAVLAPLFKMLEAAFDLTVPLIVASVIDNGIALQDTGYILTRFLLMIAMAILGLVSSFVAQYFSARAAVGTAAGLRHELLSKIQSFSFHTLDDVGTATLVTRMTGDIFQVQNGVNMLLRLLLRSPFIVFGALILALLIDSVVALVFVGAILLLFFIVFGIMHLTTPMYHRVQERVDDLTSSVRENLYGVRVIRAFAREETEKKRFTEKNRLLTEAHLRVGKVAALMNPLSYLVINTAIILILWLGASRVEGGLLLSGSVIALISYISQILVELVKLANLVVLLGKSMSSMTRVGQVLDLPAGISFSDGKAISDVEEILRFENVSLRYNDTGDNALSDISFSIQRGENVGVIGGTGSGKSSLVHLISRFYDATEGVVYLKGMPIASLSREEILSSVATVMQRAMLFSGNVRSNMQFGRPDATDEEIWKALDTAQAAEFVRAWEDGLDHAIQEGGTNLSGGQKQRLTIARAIVANCDILILDDSASALDYATEAALRHAISSLPEKMTVITVSQRAGSISKADKILVLDDGYLVGCGKHEELLGSCDVYKEIYDSQFSGEVAK